MQERITNKSLKARQRCYDYYSKSYIGDFFDEMHGHLVLYFKNVRYIVSKKFKSLAEFNRQLIAKHGVGCAANTIRGYELGYFIKAELNWLVCIAMFLKSNFHEMMTVDMSTRGNTIAA